MIGGSVIVAACLIVLGWSKEIVEYFMGAAATVRWYGMHEEVDLLTSGQKGTASIMLAVASIYVLDFAINAGNSIIKRLGISINAFAVQWSCRSLIIDTLPISKQQIGSSWGKVGQRRSPVETVLT